MLLDAVRGTKGVLQQPPPDCFPIRFSESAVTYVLRVWADDFLTLDPVLGEVRGLVRVRGPPGGPGDAVPDPPIVSRKSAADAADGRLSALDQIDLFASIEGACRGRLAGEMREQHFGAGEDIIRQDKPGDSLFLIAQGTVDVRVAVDGARRSVARLGPGQFFGEMSLMTGEPRQATWRRHRHGLLRRRPGPLPRRARRTAVRRRRHLGHPGRAPLSSSRRARST